MPSWQSHRQPSGASSIYTCTKLASSVIVPIATPTVTTKVTTVKKKLKELEKAYTVAQVWQVPASRQAPGDVWGSETTETGDSSCCRTASPMRATTTLSAAAIPWPRSIWERRSRRLSCSCIRCMVLRSLACCSCWRCMASTSCCTAPSLAAIMISVLACKQRWCIIQYIYQNQREPGEGRMLVPHVRSRVGLPALKKTKL